MADARTPDAAKRQCRAIPPCTGLASGPCKCPGPVQTPPAANGDEIVDFKITVERTYKVNLSKIRRDFATELTEDMQSREEYHVLRETVCELCGFDRDEDHIDGSYVWLSDESADYDADLDLRQALRV
jgi:hypothetical protein